MNSLTFKKDGQIKKAQKFKENDENFGVNPGSIAMKFAIQFDVER